LVRKNNRTFQGLRMSRRNSRPLSGKLKTLGLNVSGDKKECRLFHFRLGTVVFLLAGLIVFIRLELAWVSIIIGKYMHYSKVAKFFCVLPPGVPCKAAMAVTVSAKQAAEIGGLL
jgi:hypothetical protein